MGKRDRGMEDMLIAMSITPPEECPPAVCQPATSVQPWASETDDRESGGPLSRLQVITVPELSLRNHHCGRVLYGQFGIQPSLSWSQGWSFNDVVTILVDENANGMRVIMTKHLWDAAPTPERDYCFALGKRVAIKDPLMEVCCDGVSAVRLINLAQVVCLEKANEDGEAPAESNDTTLLEELQKIRLEANRLVAENDWASAITKYSECIEKALGEVSGNNRSLHKTSLKNLSHVLMSAYSNRAEARLRLEHYEDAYTDVEKALEIEPTHAKTLIRKGTAAHGLGLFETACKAFKAALAKLLEEQSDSAMKKLRASTTAMEQSRTGQYDLSEFFRTGKVASFADFVGPVEIGRVGYGHERRGLLATRDIKPGELILLSNPVAVHRSTVPAVSLSDDAWSGPGCARVRMIDAAAETDRDLQA